jgi:predicted nucleotidyltransferase
MRLMDPPTENAVRNFLARIPTDVRVERAILFGSRARGENRPDSDADLALIVSGGDDVWQLTWLFGGFVFEVYVETGIMIQPVVISLDDWLHPERFARPSFLRNVAQEGVTL